MNFIRMFSYTRYKGEKNYLRNQRKYEIVRTFLYFFLSFSLLAGGYFATHTRANLLTIVAVLGCLPACKSLVSAIMFCRYKGLSKEEAELFYRQAGTLPQLFDMVFTSYKETFQVDHLVVQDNFICGYSKTEGFHEKEFEKHITSILQMDHIKDVSVKIFTDSKKYSNRLVEMANKAGEETPDKVIPMIETLKSVAL